jgi:hypothetical protein
MPTLLIPRVQHATFYLGNDETRVIISLKCRVQEIDPDHLQDGGTRW